MGLPVGRLTPGGGGVGCLSSRERVARYVMTFRGFLDYESNQNGSWQILKTVA